jgi:ABC-2 type transport system permease protein
VTVATAPALRNLPPGHYRFSGALRSEWTKVRTVRSTAWCVLATVVAGIGIGILASASEASRWRSGDVIDMLLFDPTSVSLTGLIFGQLALGVLGVLTISAEYGSGSIRATLAAIPRRPVVLGAKALVFGVVAFVVSEAVSFGAFFVGQAIMSGSAPTATLSDHDVLRAVIGGGLFLTVLGLFALGLATIIRHTAGSITTFVAILLILPLVDSAFPAKIGWPIGRYLPATIGAAMTSTTSRGAHADFLPSFPFWHGFALLCAYALASLVIGGALMIRRDP